MSENTIGDVALDETCNGVHVINELGVPVLVMGLQNIIISVSPDGILVSDKGQSEYLKNYVGKINREVMYAEKSWGCFRVLDADKDSITIKVTIKPGDSMNYHCHNHRNEVWVVVSGQGQTVIDGMKQFVNAVSYTHLDVYKRQACGCLCVATDVGDVARIILDSECMVPSGNIPILAEKMNDMFLLSADEKAIKSKKNRQRIVSLFNIYEIVRCYEKIYKHTQ